LAVVKEVWALLEYLVLGKQVVEVVKELKESLGVRLLAMHMIGVVRELWMPLA
jgi:uncharacterized protein with ACT and thioredoxin-like domain